MTTPDAPTGRRLDRLSAGCLAGAGLLLLPTAAHPDILETTLAQAALHTPLWTEMHAALVVSNTLSLVALTALYARRAARLGRLGAIGFALAVPGLVVAACAFYWEAFLLPVIARVSPELFAWDGPVAASWGVRSGALAGLWLVGYVLLGLALARGRALPPPAALTFAASALAFAVFAGPFVPVLGLISTVAFAAAHVRLGAALWTSAPAQVEPVQRPATPAGR